MFLAAISMVVLYYLVTYIFYVIAGIRIFAKFGEPGWKAIIPFYNTYVQYSKVWSSTMGIASVALTLIHVVGSNYTADNAMLSMVIAIIGGVNFIVTLLGNIKLAKSFGHGTGFGLGLTFLQPIFILILGYSGDPYIGNTTEQ